LVRSDIKGRGLGWKLMELMVRYARSEGLTQIEGELQENSTMIQMCRELGFEMSHDPDDGSIRHATLHLE
jgi:acetyltransferase